MSSVPITEGEWEFRPATGAFSARIRAGDKDIAGFKWLDNPDDGVLMAAAPDLLAACEAALVDQRLTNRTDALIRAAIAKAVPADGQAGEP